MADYVKLANDQGSFFDPETKLSISRDDVEELTEPIGKLTRERLKWGGLVRCPPPTVGPASVPDTAKPDTHVEEPGGSQGEDAAVDQAAENASGNSADMAQATETQEGESVDPASSSPKPKKRSKKSQK